MVSDATAERELSVTPFRSRRRPWWHGGSSTARWDSTLLGLGLSFLGLAVVTTAGLPWLLPTSVVFVVTSVVLWAVLLVPVVVAFRRSVPRGLLRFRPIDLLYGIVLGLGLRLVQGLLQTWETGSTPVVPSSPTLDGTLPVGTWAADGVTTVLVGPVVEEFFFRGVLLVAIFTVARRRWDSTAGRFLAVVGSTALFVAAHALLAPLTTDQTAALRLVGLVCGSLVMYTGRLWGAVLVHVVYNGSLLALLVVGTVLA